MNIKHHDSIHYFAFSHQPRAKSSVYTLPEVTQETAPPHCPCPHGDLALRGCSAPARVWVLTRHAHWIAWVTRVSEILACPNGVGWTVPSADPPDLGGANAPGHPRGKSMLGAHGLRTSQCDRHGDSHLAGSQHKPMPLVELLFIKCSLRGILFLVS